MFSLLGMSRVLVSAAVLLGYADHATAQVNVSHVQIELIPETVTAQAGQMFSVGLLFRMDPGWHIYWQNPGDAGEPPRVQWILPPGFTSGPILWPQPVRLGAGSVADYGYENQVLLIAPIHPPANSPAGSGGRIGAEVKYIVCREMCIPGKARVTLSSPSSPQQSSAWRQLFAQTRAQLPKAAPAAWSLSAKADPQHFSLFVRTASKVRAATFFPLQAGQVDNSAAQEFASTSYGFRLKLKKSDLLVQPLARLEGLLVFGPGRAYQIAVPVAAR
jgi:DsbC/DsbD-like thiol-disulfide interchange protein